MSAPPQTRHPPKLLPRTFYSRSPEIVARALLGKLLIRDLHGERLTGRITEVEAYLGLTPSNAVLLKGTASAVPKKAASQTLPLCRRPE
jgi:3-methyladenine DNA glycosylase Mpg